LQSDVVPKSTVFPSLSFLSARLQADREADDVACPLQVLVWRADAHVRTLVSKDDRMFFDILLDLPIATSGGGASAVTAASAMEVGGGGEAEATSDEPAAKKARTEASNDESCMASNAE